MQCERLPKRVRVAHWQLSAPTRFDLLRRHRTSIARRAHLSYRVHSEARRRLASLVAFPHRDIRALEMPAKAIGIEQRIREPMFRKLRAHVDQSVGVRCKV